MAELVKTQAVFQVDERSSLPKYCRIIENVKKALRGGIIGKSDQLPSINAVCRELSVSRDTVVKAYNALKEQGILETVPGKGFFLKTDHCPDKRRIFVLFDVLLTGYKEQLYKGLVAEIAGKVDMDIYFHHHNPKVFCRLMRENRGLYEYYVVMPFPHESARRVLATCDQDKLMLLDIDVDFPGKKCATICQNFDDQLCKALAAGLDRIKTYAGFTLVFPIDSNHPVEIQDAFRNFCTDHGIAFTVIHEMRQEFMRPGQAYLVIEDTDLVDLVKFAKGNDMKIGVDIGILAYNDTPLKEVVADGISVVSIDFVELGRKAGRQILNPQKINEVHPTRLIRRGSL